jgi:hypothetical protein
MPTCPHCSSETPQSATTCPSCARPLNLASGQQPVNAKVSALSIAGLYLGVASVLFTVTVIATYMSMRILLQPDFEEWDHFAYAFLAATLALCPILATLSIGASWMARRRIKRSEGRLSGGGRALAGLVTGSLGGLPYLFVLGSWALTALGIVHPHVLGGSPPVGLLRMVNAAAEKYRATYHRGYPIALSVLGPPRGGGQPNALGANLIDEALASGVKSGCVVIYKITARDENHFPTAYEVTASPVEGCDKGRVCYFTDQTTEIRLASGRMADEDSSILAGPESWKSEPHP